MSAKRSVLVTGATGLIGRGTLAPLLARGFEVHAVTTQPPPTWSPPGVVWHRADLLAPGGPASVVAAAGPEALLHFAWHTEPGALWDEPENLDWVSASLQLLRAFADAGGSRAVLAGTCAEYSWDDTTICDAAATALVPATLYGVAKNGLRLIAEAHAARAGYELAWGRIFHTFGPHEDPRRLGASVAAALTSGRPAQTSHGGQVRDVLYSVDVAEAFVEVLCSHVTGPLNVASGVPIALRELVSALGAAAGRPDLVQLGAHEPRPGEPAALVAEVRILREEVGWRPRRTLREAAEETIAWWREQGACV
jgi:nucleoside-diphosphate-sugar epimerase